MEPLFRNFGFPKREATMERVEKRKTCSRGRRLLFNGGSQTNENRLHPGESGGETLERTN